MDFGLKDVEPLKMWALNIVLFKLRMKSLIIWQTIICQEQCVIYKSYSNGGQSLVPTPAQFWVYILSAKHVSWSKQFINILAWRLKMKTIKELFSGISKVWENKMVLHFSNLASRRRYWQFVLLNHLHVCLKSPVREVPVL